MATAGSDLDPRNTAPSRGEDDGTASVRASQDEALGEHAEALADFDLVKIMQACERENLESLASLKGEWQRSYRAFHSKHWHGSKYTEETYKYRSRLFRPKTRAAIRKNMATAAAALFSTTDAVAVRSEYEDDLMSSASAAILHEILNYRLDRTSPRGGIPWFRVAMGAHLDAQITCTCVSKQTWDYRTYRKKRPTIQPVADEMGMPLMDGFGMPMMQQVMAEEEIVYADRPHIELYPPEHVWVDLRASWLNPVQEGNYVILRHQMSVGALRQMMETQNPHSPIVWLELDEGALNQGTRDYDNAGIRSDRESSRKGERPEDRDAPADDFKLVWVHEVFMRFHGVDYNWWTLGSRTFLSQVACTGDVYPQYAGARPIVQGVASIEPHVLFGQSPVESWQPIQQESNDLVNLHLDALRQSIEPLVKVKTGSLFDVKQLRMRGAAGANIVVRDMEDIEIDRIPPPPGDVFISQNHLNADFDDLAGVFSAGSVQTNRSLNETVGGMRLLTGAANAVSEFDLRVWVETWVEPTIRQVLQCIQFFESDERILALAGQRAQLMQRYNVNEVTDELLEAEVLVTVNVGIGAADPMQRAQKLQMALQTLGGVAEFADRPVKVNMEELIREVMGAAGYKEGMKYFVLGEPGEPPPPDPEMEKLKMEQQIKELQLQVQERIADKGNLNKTEVTRLAGLIETVQLIIQQEGAQMQAAEQAAMDERNAGMKMMGDLFMENQRGMNARGIASERNQTQERVAGQRDATQRQVAGERNQSAERMGGQKLSADLFKAQGANAVQRDKTASGERVQQDRNRVQREGIQSGERSASRRELTQQRIAEGRNQTAEKVAKQRVPKAPKPKPVKK